MTSTPTHTIGFLGAGQMATALARGWIHAKLLNKAKSLASDPMPAAVERFTTATGIHATASNTKVIDECEIVVIAVKPQMLPGLLAEVKPAITPKHLVISIAAGVPLAKLAEGLGKKTRLVRVMPNMPALIGMSAAGYAMSPTATEADAELAAELFGSVGVAYPVAEHLLDAVTGLSGSGPAYTFVMIEALADGGVRMGLPREVAVKLAAQTVLGAAAMVLQTGQHPGSLKDAVASPGGTTIAGLHALEQAGFRAALMDAVQTATERSKELGSA